MSRIERRILLRAWNPAHRNITKDLNQVCLVNIRNDLFSTTTEMVTQKIYLQSIFISDFNVLFINLNCHVNLSRHKHANWGNSHRTSHRAKRFTEMQQTVLLFPDTKHSPPQLDDGIMRPGKRKADCCDTDSQTKSVSERGPVKNMSGRYICQPHTKHTNHASYAYL